MTDTSNANTERAKSFSEFGLHPDLLKAISASGYTVATPIQAQAIPAIIDGRDVMGAAQTGTGKTAAFTLPLLHRLMPYASHSTSPARHPVRALILAPTRELADQVADSVKRYSESCPLRVAVVFGGVDISAQKEELRKGCELVIATPGRLLDHIEQKTINLSQVNTLVLDEADRMLDMGFLPDLERIVKLLPKSRQSLLFSATFSGEIRKLARSFLKSPIEINVAPQNATAENVTQIAYPVSGNNKQAAVLYLLKSRSLSQVIIFVNTKIGASRLTHELVKEGIKAESIHGDKSQLERIKALESFKSGETTVLVATDVAARGLDVAGLPCVINVDLPFNPEDYVHRIGRTGRAGASGEAIALYTDHEEKLLEDIEKLIKVKVPRGTLNIPEVFQHRGHASTSGDSRARGKGERFKRTFPASRPAPIDDFFFKPYEPAVKDPHKEAQRLQQEQKWMEHHATSKQPQLAVLLGGRPKNIKPAESGD